MRKILITTLMATGAAIAATPAQAQEMSPFTGFRLEALAGWDHLRNGSTVDIDDDDVEDVDESIDGLLYGIGAGFDFDLQGFVVGIEAELSDSTGEEDPGQALNAPFAFRAKVGRDIYVGARAGMLVTPQTLVYVKGGYTNTRIEAAIDDLDPTDPTDFETENDQTIDGYRIGAGVEHLLGGTETLGFGSGAYVKLEYRYSNYSDLSFDDDFFTPPNAVDIDLDRHQVVAGLGVRF